MRKWLPIMILASAQFVMVLDSSVMNVSISQIVDDLDTTIQGVQLAITVYTLVMAAFMLVGAKLGDIWGRDRVFAIGLAVYGLGSLTTALSPNLTVLLFGWSLVEGLGAVLVIPAIAALIAANYEGKDRALAYGIIGGVAGAAIAAGPLIGGWVTTDVQLALRLRRRDRDRRRDPARAPADASRRRRPSTRRSSTSSARPSRPRASGCSCSGSSRAASGAGSSPRGALTIGGHGDHAVRLLGRPVPDPRRARASRRVRGCGRSAASARAGHAARPRAAADRARSGPG